MKLLLLLGLALLVSCGGPKKTEADKAAKTDALEDVNISVVTMEFAVDGMTCTGCEQTVEKTVAALPGVKTVKASHTGKTVIINVEEGKVAKDEVEKAIEGAGYEIIKE